MEENRVLREQIGDRRMRFSDDQRRRLAARAKAVGAINTFGKIDAKSRLRVGGSQGGLKLVHKGAHHVANLIQVLLF